MDQNRLILIILLIAFIDYSRGIDQRSPVINDLYPLPKRIKYSDPYQYGPDCVLIEQSSNALKFVNHSEWSGKEITSIRLFYKSLHNDLKLLDDDTFSGIPTLKLQYIHIHRYLMLPEQDYLDSFNDTIPFGKNEYYDLRVFQDGIYLYAYSKYGVYQGLKTIAMISTLYQDTYCVKYTPFRIDDEPRFKYRGVLIDTGRSYYSIDYIKSIIRGIGLLRFNTLHWHIIDDQSFSMEILNPKIKNLHLKGANHLGYIHNELPTDKGKFYLQSEIKEIIEYAEERGIRVIPEIDIPGHTRSWGVAYDKLTAKCPKLMESTRLNQVSREYTYSIPLDISQDYTYDVIAMVLEEVVNLFHDPFIHLGGDEVDIRCWNEDEKLKKRMKKLGYDSPETYILYFKARLNQILKSNTILSNKTIIQWEDILMESDEINTSLENHKSKIYQVWKGDDSLDLIKKKKSRFIYSFGNYLDPSYQSCKSFKECYNQRNLIDLELKYNNYTESNNTIFLGVEACGWELMEEPNQISIEKDGIERFERSFSDQAWFKLIAISEKLWTPTKTLGLLKEKSDCSERALRLTEKFKKILIPISYKTKERIK